MEFHTDSKKNALDVLQFPWRLTKLVWHKQEIPTSWRRAGGILILKENGSLKIQHFHLVSLLIH